MTLQELTDRFNELLNIRDSFYRETVYWGGTYNDNSVDKMKPSTVIIKLKSKGFNFTQQHFDKFIKSAVFKKSSSFLVGYSYQPGSREEAIRIMFRKFVPTTAQFKTLFSCYNTGGKHYWWVDELLQTGYQFTDAQLKKLGDCKYDMTQIYKTKAVSVEDLEEILKGIDNTKVNIIEELIEKNKIVPSKQCMINLIDSLNWVNNYNKEQDKNTAFIKLLTDNGCMVDDECFNSLPLNKKNYISNHVIYAFIKNGCQLKLEHMLNACQMGNWYQVLYFIKWEVEVNTECLDKILSQVSNYYHNNPHRNHMISASYNHEEIKIYETGKTNGEINMYKLLIDKGVKPSINTLEIVCSKGMVDEFVDITNNFKIYPNKKCLDLSMKSSTDNIILEILNYKIIPDEETFYSLNDGRINFYKRLEVLLNYCLKVTMNMVENAMSRNQYIPDLERFGIPYDDSLYYWCHRYNSWPETYVKKIKDNIDKKVLKIRYICKDKKTTVEQLNKFMLDNSIKPDRYCLENSLLYNYSLAEYMINKLNCEPTLASLAKASNAGTRSYYNNKQLDIIILNKLEEKYNFDFTIMAKPYDHIILEDLEPLPGDN